MNKQKVFTLVEMLTVLAIIAILLALLLPAAQLVRRRGFEAQAQAMIDSIGIALSAYHLDFSRYVPDGDEGSSFQREGINYTHENALFIALTTEFTGDLGESKKAGPYLECKERDIGASITDPSYSAIIDPWDTPYQYDEMESESETVGDDPGRGCREHDLDGTGGNEDRSVAGASHNHYSFDLWSFGANKTNENGRRRTDLPAGDDINNW